MIKKFNLALVAAACVAVGGIAVAQQSGTPPDSAASNATITPGSPMTPTTPDGSTMTPGGVSPSGDPSVGQNAKPGTQSGPDGTTAAPSATTRGQTMPGDGSTMGNTTGNSTGSTTGTMTGSDTDRAPRNDRN
jgi:hypothetical protein